MRMCNISSVLSDNGKPHIDGYKPRSNVGTVVRQMIQQALGSENENVKTAGSKTARYLEIAFEVINSVSPRAASIDEIYAMVEAGETGGFLDLVLAQIAEFQARDKELRGKVLSAMIYPAVLMFLAIAVLIFLMVFFIPRFKTLFEGFDAALPMLTQVIVAASEFCQRYGIFVIIGIAFLVYLARTWVTSARGRRIYERWLLTAPVIGPLSSQFAMARFSRMLGTLIHAGVPLVSGLNVAQRSIGNQILTDAIEDSIERVKKGEPLARSLGDCSLLFSGATVEMISVAEESSRLDKELIRLAEVTEKELDQQLKTAVALMEPLMLFFIAAFIGTIFVGMVIPIFTIQDYIK